MGRSDDCRFGFAGSIGPPGRSRWSSQRHGKGIQVHSTTVMARPKGPSRDPVSEAKARVSQYLTQADALITHIASSASPAIITTPDTDADGPTVLFANGAFLKMVGKRLKDVIGRSAWPFLIDPSDTPRLGSLQTQLANNGFARAKRLRSDGDTVYVDDLIVSKISDEDSRPGVFLAIQPGVSPA